MPVKIHPKVRGDLCRLPELILCLDSSGMLPCKFQLTQPPGTPVFAMLESPLSALGSKNYFLVDGLSGCRLELVCYHALPVVPVSENIIVLFSNCWWW